MSNGTNRTSTGGFDVVLGFRLAGIATTVLIVIQAMLAGRSFFLGADLIEIHGFVGNITFIAALVLLGCALAGQRDRRLDRFDLGVSALVVLLIIVQLGLGYSGRDNATAAAWHWPNGVLITLLGAMLLGRTLPRR